MVLLKYKIWNGHTTSFRWKNPATKKSGRKENRKNSGPSFGEKIPDFFVVLSHKLVLCHGSASSGFNFGFGRVRFFAGNIDATNRSGKFFPGPVSGAAWAKIGRSKRASFQLLVWLLTAWVRISAESWFLIDDRWLGFRKWVNSLFAADAATYN